MLSKNCTSQTISKYLLGLIFLGLSVVFVILGFTLFPIFGLLLAIPVAGLAIYIFQTRLNDQCELEV